MKARTNILTDSPDSLIFYERDKKGQSQLSVVLHAGFGGYKSVCMLNSAEHEFYPAHKC